MDRIGQHRNERKATKVAAASRRRAHAFAVASAAVIALAFAVCCRPLPMPRRTSGSMTKGSSITPTRFRPEALNKGNVELDKQGVPVKKTDPALTPEQRKARADGRRAPATARQGSRTGRTARPCVARYVHDGRRDRSRAEPRRQHDRCAGPVVDRLRCNAQQAQARARQEEGGAGRQARAARSSSVSLPTSRAELAKQAELIAAKQKEIIDRHRALRRGQEALEGIARGDRAR